MPDFLLHFAEGYALIKKADIKKLSMSDTKIRGKTRVDAASAHAI